MAIQILFQQKALTKSIFGRAKKKKNKEKRGGKKYVEEVEDKRYKSCFQLLRLFRVFPKQVFSSILSSQFEEFRFVYKCWNVGMLGDANALDDCWIVALWRDRSKFDWTDVSIWNVDLEISHEIDPFLDRFDG